MLSLLEDVQVLRPRRYTPSATQNFPYRPKKHAVFSSCLTGPALHRLGSDSVTKVEAHPSLQRQARSAQPASVYSRHGAIRCSAKIFTPLRGGTALPQLSDMSLRKSPNGNMATHWSYDFGLDQRHPAFRLWKCGPWADDVPKVSRIRKSKILFSEIHLERGMVKGDEKLLHLPTPAAGQRLLSSGEVESTCGARGRIDGGGRWRHVELEIRINERTRNYQPFARISMELPLWVTCCKFINPRRLSTFR